MFLILNHTLNIVDMMNFSLIKEMNITILDIEGSGGSVRNDPYGTGSIVSLGAVDFNSKDEFYEECKVMEGRGYDEQALKVNGFSKDMIYDGSKQSVLELISKLENFCMARKSKLLGAWGDYDRKMLFAAYEYYGRKWNLPDRYINLKSISKAILGKNNSGLSNTAIKLGMPPERHPHVGINGARLATENISVMLFKTHYYKEYSGYTIPSFKLREFELPIVNPIAIQKSE